VSALVRDIDQRAKIAGPPRTRRARWKAAMLLTGGRVRALRNVMACRATEWMEEIYGAGGAGGRDATANNERASERSLPLLVLLCGCGVLGAEREEEGGSANRC